MITQTTYLSKEKYKELQEEIKHLQSTARKEIAEKLSFAKSLGDLSENAEYHEARDEQAKLESRIAKIEDTLKRAKIMTTTKGDTVNVGSTVVLKTSSGEKETWRIVGSEEVDLLEKRISNESPLGKALLGKKKGDEVIIATPKGAQKYTVLKLE